MTGLRRFGDRDLPLWVGLVGLIVFEHLSIATTGGSSPWWWLLLAAVLVAGAVVIRRTRPHLALAMVSALVAVRLLWALNHEGPFPVSYAVALAVVSWLAGRHADNVRGMAAIVVVGNTALLVVGLLLRGEMGVAEAFLTWLFMVFWSLIFIVLPWLLGRYRRQQALLASAGWERAERMEHEQRLLVEQARLRERALIAQDMHDSLGHELSLIALRAAALEVAPDLSATHQRSAGEVRDAAATATERLGEIIGVLREEGATAPLSPVGGGIPDLVERATASGMDVHLLTSGAPSDAPVVVRQAAYRVAQEGLTNAAKHAPGGAVAVRVRHTGDGTTVSVTNGPAARDAERADGSGGHGLRGLGERLELVGGTLHAGERGGDGYELTARIPHEAAPRATSPSGSMSALERDTARRSARRGLVVALLAPLAMGLALGAVILGYYVGTAYVSILDPADYGALRAGQTRAEIEDVLPPLEMLDAPSSRGGPAPDASACEFYRPDGPFSISFAYRLCFVDDKLVSKDVVQTGSVPADPEDP